MNSPIHKEANSEPSKEEHEGQLDHYGFGSLNFDGTFDSLVWNNARHCIDTANGIHLIAWDRIPYFTSPEAKGEIKFRLGHYVEGRSSKYSLRLPTAIDVGGGVMANEYEEHSDALIMGIRGALDEATRGRVEHRTTVAPSEVNRV